MKVLPHTRRGEDKTFTNARLLLTQNCDSVTLQSQTGTCELNSQLTSTYLTQNLSQKKHVGSFCTVRKLRSKEVDQYKIIQLLKVRTRTQGLGYSSKMIPFLKIKGAKPIFFNLNDNDTCAYLVAQSCLTLWDPTDCSPSGSSVHWILQARILAWVAMPSSRESFQPRY